MTVYGHILPGAASIARWAARVNLLTERAKYKKRYYLHYFIYPRTPKQNTYVEIFHWADEREFYQQGNVCSILSVMQQKIKEREYIWNNIRPHEALGQLTPSQYFLKLQTQKLPTRNVIILQT